LTPCRDRDARITPKRGAHNTMPGSHGNARLPRRSCTSRCMTIAESGHSVAARSARSDASIRPFTVKWPPDLLLRQRSNQAVRCEVGRLKSGPKSTGSRYRGSPPGQVKRHGCPSTHRHDARRGRAWVVDATRAVHIFAATVMPPKRNRSRALKVRDASRLGHVQHRRQRSAILGPGAVVARVATSKNHHRPPDDEARGRRARARRC